jgi:IS30 family transposase
MDASHSNINQKKLAEYRRDQVFRLSSMGYSQPKIASVLNVSQSLISLDIALLRQRAREAISVYLENKLPLIFNKSWQVFLTKYIKLGR